MSQIILGLERVVDDNKQGYFSKCIGESEKAKGPILKDSHSVAIW